MPRIIRLFLIFILLALSALLFRPILIAGLSNIVAREILHGILRVEDVPRQAVRIDPILPTLTEASDTGLAVWTGRLTHLDSCAPAVNPSALLATAHFVLGDVESAMQFATRLDQAEGASPLSTPGQIEYYIVCALRAESSGNWQSALTYYRQAAMLAADNVPVAYDGLQRALVAHYQSKVEDNPQDIEARYRLAVFLARSADLEAAATHFRILLADTDFRLPERQLALVHYYLGRLTEEREELAAAEKHYTQSLAVDPHFVETYSRLVGVQRQLGYPSKQIAYVMADLSGLEPRYFLGARLDDSWILRGFDLMDPTTLDTGAPVLLALYWRGSQAPKEQVAGWIHQGKDRWIQVVTVPNLVPNPGFEWDERQGPLYPMGFPYGIFGYEYEDGKIMGGYPGETVDNHVIVSDRVNSRLSSVFGLRNTPGVRRSSLSSIAIPVEPGAFYLQGGWLHNPGPGSLGHFWGSNYPEGESAFDYVGPVFGEQEWAYYAGVIQVPPWTDRVRLWLINWESEHTVYYDDLLFVRIEIPPAS